MSSRRNAGAAPVVPDMLAEHLEEVAFLSIQRRKLLFAPDVPYISFPPHDERIAAHWDGLVTNLPASIDIAAERIDEFDPWEGYAAARVWMELGSPAATEVAQRIVATDAELHGGWREALRRLPTARLIELFPADAKPHDPAVLACLVYAWGWHGALTESAAASAALGTDAAARYAAARAIGWSAAVLPSAAPLLSSLLGDDEPRIRRAALWSVAQVQPLAAAEQARRRVGAGDADAFDLRVLGLLGGAADADLLLALIEGAHPQRAAALRALGELGTPPALDVLMARLSAPDETMLDAVKDGLHSAMGMVPEGKDGASPEPHEIAAWWRDAAPAWRREPRWLRGRPFPWRGAPAEEPMEALWRSLLLAPRADFEWLRREVPDGFFDDELRDDAVAGE
jgi:hypothetical protein